VPQSSCEILPRHYTAPHPSCGILPQHYGVTTFLWDITTTLQCHSQTVGYYNTTRCHNHPAGYYHNTTVPQPTCGILQHYTVPQHVRQRRHLRRRQKFKSHIRSHRI
jgi:hypothetical protein